MPTNPPARQGEIESAFAAARDRRNATAPEPVAPSENFLRAQEDYERDTSFINFKDAALSIPRGAEALVTSAFNLSNSIGPAAPLARMLNGGEDFQVEANPIFGDPDTPGGALFSGLAQFIIPYGAIGKGVSLAAKGAQGAKHLRWINPAAATSFRGRVAAEAAKGAVVDFVFFDDEENVANLFKDTPLQNDVSDFLAIDDNDGAIERRLKSTLVGAGLGVFADGFISGLSHTKGLIRGGRRRLKVDQVREVIEKNLADIASKESKALEGIEEFAAEGRKTYGDLMGLEYDKIEGFVKGGDNAEAIQSLVTQAREGLDEGRELQELFPNFTGDPKAMTSQERFALVLDASQANLRRWGNKDAAVFYRALEDMHRGAMDADLAAGKITLEEMQEASRDAMTKVLRLNHEEAGLWIQRQIKEGLEAQEQIRELGIKGLFIRDLANHKVDQLKRLTEALPSVESMTLEELDRYATEMESTVAMMQVNRGIGAEQSRALGGRRSTVQGGQADVELRLNDELNLGNTIEDRMARRGGDDKSLRKRLRAMQAAIDARGIEALDEIAKATGKEGWGAPFKGFLDEVFFNFVLSGPRTHAVNFISNLGYMAYRPFNQITGGVLTGNRDAVEVGLLEYRALLEGWREVLTYTKLSDGTRSWVSEQGKAARKAVKNRQGTLIGDAGKVEVQNAAKSGNWIIENIIRLPSKALQGSDELAKQIAARARTKALISHRAHRLGRAKGLTNEEIAYKIQSEMDRAFKEGKALTEADLRSEAASEIDEALGIPLDQMSPREAAIRQKHIDQRLTEKLADEGDLLESTQSGIDRAQDITFTRSLEDQPGVASAIGRGAQRFRESIPGASWILPFVQTPTNIVTATLENSPVDAAKGAIEFILKHSKALPDNYGYKSKFLRQLTSGDPLEKADAIGRLAFATAATAGVYSLAQNWADPEATFGLVGAGPRDYKERQNWEQSGVQFNSMFYTNDDGTRTYIPFSRVEPFGTFFGIVADMATYGHFVDPSEREDATQGFGLLSSLMTSVAVNLTSKTYLKGLSDALEVGMSGEPRKTEKWANRLAASFVVPNVLTQGQRAFDADLKQERDFMDILISRSGWGADSLERKRNALGETRKRFPAAGQDSLGRWVAMWNPFTISETSKDPVDREMARLSTSFSPPSPRRQIRGVRVDLLSEDFKTESGQTAYDRWQEIVRTIGGNRNLKARLRRLVTSKRYERMSEASADGIASEKAAEIRRYITEHRERALRQLRKEIPAINDFVKEARGDQQNAPRNTFPDFLETQR